MKIPFVGPTYVSVSPKWDCERAINCYVERAGSDNAVEPSALLSRPGLRAKVDLTTGAIRGMHEPRAQGASGDLIVVRNDKVYRVSTAFVATEVGTVGGGTTPVSITDNGIDAIIVDGTASGWTLGLASNTVAAISQAGFYGGTRVDFLNGYFILNKPNTQIFYHSNLYSTTFVAALNEFSAESIPDKLQTLAVANREIWLLGKNSLEVYFHADAAPIFQRLQGATTLVGCAAPYSVAVHETNVFWLGGSMNSPVGVYKNEGYNARRISPPAIERVISQRANLADVVGYTYSEDSHLFYVLNFLTTTDTALVYDLSSDLWHERGFSSELNVLTTPTVVVVAPLALFSGGVTTAETVTTEKYTYSTDGILVGANLQRARKNLAGAGDAIVGIIGGGQFNSTVVSWHIDRYTYARDVMVAGNALSQASTALAAAASTTHAVFGGGLSGVYLAIVQKYGFRDDTATATTVLSAVRSGLAAAGNTTTARFSGGFDSAAYVATTDKHTHATDTITSATALTAIKGQLAACSSATAAIFAGGTNSTTILDTSDVYTYATETVISGPVLSVARYALAAGSDGFTGVFAGGSSATGQVATTDKYTHSANSFAVGTVLLTGTRSALAGVSSS